jgi:flagellar biogenesis protein FliO
MFDLRKRSSKVPVIPVTGLGILIEFVRRLVPAFRQRAAAGGALEHLTSLPLTAQASLALVRLHKETLLLGITPQSITLLTKAEEPEAAPRTPSESPAARGESSSR